MRLLSKTLLASLVAVASQGAFAPAFQLHETSTSGLGRAYAGMRQWQKMLLWWQPTRH